MIEPIKNNSKKAMDKAMEVLQQHLGKVRTGRANISMLDSIRVNYYGTPTPLNQVGSVSCPDAKSFLIAPWESSLLKEIESSIVKSDIGMTPINDGKVVRLKLPDLTEERRKDLAKQVGKIAEEARVAIRLVRRDSNEVLKKALKEKQISEDEEKKGLADVQKMTDDFIKKIDQIGAEKEKELLTL